MPAKKSIADAVPPLLPYEERIVGIEVSEKPRPVEDDDRRKYRRQQVEKAARGEAPTFASWTLTFDDGLAIFNRAASKSWWVRGYDLEPILAHWGLKALDGIVNCGAGAPAETVRIAAHIDSPRIAPMMAEAFGRLAKQRSIAEKWLFDFPEAAAIGLVPAAVHGAKKPRDFARGALTLLIEGGKGDVVRAVAERYGALAGLADLLGKAKTKPKKDADAEVRDLEQRLRNANPSKETFARLDALTRIDSDRALFAVAELASKARSRPLRRRAEQALEAVRSRRGLSEDDLAVRMIPTAGLDDPEVTIKKETYRLCASPSLEPRLSGPDGRRTSKLPSGAPESVKKRWSLFAKELRTLAKSTRDRLERRMIAGDAWSADVFRAHVVGHPLLVELARGLVFAAGKELFRVAEDGSLADEDDRAFVLASSATVTIVHPLDVGAKALARWAERFGEYEIVQPFEQLGRAFFKTKVEGGRIGELEGTKLEPQRILALERRGWERGHIDHGPTLESMRRELPGLRVDAWFKPGIALGDPMGSGMQKLTSVNVSGADGPKIPPRSLSEVMRDFASR